MLPSQAGYTSASVSAEPDQKISRKVGESIYVHPYVVDPYPHADSKLHLRQGTSELNGLSPSWFIGVHAKPTGK